MTGDLDTGYLTRLPADQRMVLEEVNGPGLAALRSYLDSGEAVAFLGAGVSAPLYPLWAGLIGEMVDAAAGRLTGKQAATCRALATSAPEEVVEIVRHSLGLPSYHAVLREVLRVRADPATNRSWTVVQELVCRCAFRGVVTTNYDPGIVDARMRVRAGASATGFMTWQDELGLDEWRTGRVFGGGELPVLYAHGVHSQPDSVVLAASDYRRAYAGKLAAVLERLADGGHLCWIGFSFADQRLTAILREVPLLSGTRHEPGIAPAHVAVMAWDPAAEANDPGILAQRAEIAFGAQVILYPASGGDHSALAALLAGLADARFPAVTARAGLAAHVAQTHGEGHDSRGKRSKNAEQGRIAGTEQARILADALRAAWLIDDEPSKASALFEIAQAVAPTDPDRAAGLTNDAERVAQSITDWDRKQSVLRELALALAATDPDRAERVAQSITGWGRKQSALTEIALAVSASDPDCAERIAQSITDERSRVSALIDMATAVSASDPDRAARLTTDAERVAQSITDERSRVSALIEMATAVSASDPDRAARLTTDAERVAQSITDKRSRASALIEMATAVSASDPDRAGRLTTDAERVAQSITDKSARTQVLAGVAKVVAATDPDRAESIAKSIRDKASKATALTDIAPVVAATDPDRALRLATDASRITRRSNVSAMASIVEVVAATDPDAAERIARSDTSEYGSAPELLARMVKAVAATDPDRAERIAQSITSGYWKVPALASIVEVVAATDPDRAERIAQSITDKPLRASALASILKALAATDPDHTGRLISDIERITQSITDGRWKDQSSLLRGKAEPTPALIRIVETVAAKDPAAAERIAQSVTDKRLRASALASVVEAVVVTDPDHAERIAQSVTDKRLRASALASVVEAVVVTDPDHAERIAQSITDKRLRASALASVVKALTATD